MNIGDTVLVKTLKNADGTAMQGKIIAAVPPLRNPVYDKHVEINRDAYDMKAVGGGSRDTVSYLVQLDGTNPFEVHPSPKKPVVVWPKNDSIEMITVDIPEELRDDALPRKRGRK